MSRAVHNRGGRERHYPQVIGDVLESTFETLDRTHHCFHVVADGEPFVQLVEEGLLCCGEGQRGEELDEVAKVVATAAPGLSSRREGGRGQQVMTNLWKEIHLVSSVSTRPDVITSSAKSFGRIPISSCRSKSMPDFCRSSTDSGANMSSLTRHQSVSRVRREPKSPEKKKRTHSMLK